MGQTEITGRSDCLMRKNGEDYVIDFACAKSHRVYLYAGSRHLLHNLTNMCRKPSAGLGLRVAMVPESYHQTSSTSRLPTRSYLSCMGPASDALGQVHMTLWHPPPSCGHPYMGGLELAGLVLHSFVYYCRLT
jgi:hypothetical protein